MTIELKYFKQFNKNKEVDAKRSYAIKALEYGVFIEGLEPISKETYQKIISMYGFDPTTANATFYSDFATAENKSNMETIIERLVHYYTAGEYIPNDVDTSIFDYVAKHLITIKPNDTQGLKQELVKFVSEPFALPSSDIAEFAEVLKEYEIYDIPGNKELQVKLITDMGIASKDPEIFLRQLIYLVTDATEFIKSQKEIDKFDREFKNQTQVLNFVKSYVDMVGIEELAKHYRPNKKIWLIIRRHVKDLRPIINRMKRVSDRVHVNHSSQTILERDYYAIDWEKIPTYQLIKLYNYLNELTQITEDSSHLQLYRVRNGRTYIKPITKKHEMERIISAQLLILQELKRRYENTDHNVYLGDSTVDIKMPTSGKNFIGAYPMYSNLPFEPKMQVGIYWESDKDLDLHAKSITGEHVGWYSGRNHNVIYTGDMIRLNSHGKASEAMKVVDPQHDAYVFNMSPFSTRGQTDGFDIFIGSTDAPIKDGVVIEPHQVVFKTHIASNDPLTFAVTTSDRVILTNFSIGGHIPDEVQSQDLIKLVERKTNAAMSLKTFCEVVGIQIVDEKDENTIDFSPEGISHNSFIQLLA